MGTTDTWSLRTTTTNESGCWARATQNRWVTGDFRRSRGLVAGCEADRKRGVFGTKARGGLVSPTAGEWSSLAQRNPRAHRRGCGEGAGATALPRRVKALERAPGGFAEAAPGTARTPTGVPRRLQAGRRRAASAGRTQGSLLRCGPQADHPPRKGGRVSPHSRPHWGPSPTVAGHRGGTEPAAVTTRRGAA